MADNYDQSKFTRSFGRTWGLTLKHAEFDVMECQAMLDEATSQLNEGMRLANLDLSRGQIAASEFPDPHAGSAETYDGADDGDAGVETAAVIE